MMIGLSGLVWTEFEGHTSDTFEGQTSDKLWRTLVRCRRPRRLILPGAFTFARDLSPEATLGALAVPISQQGRTVLG